MKPRAHAARARTLEIRALEAGCDLAGRRAGVPRTGTFLGGVAGVDVLRPPDQIGRLGKGGRSVRLHLEAEGEDEQAEPRSVGADLVAQRADLLEEARVGLLHAGRVRMPEELLDVADLPMPRPDEEANEGGATVEGPEPGGGTTQVVAELRDVVQADPDEDVVRPVLPGDLPVGDPLLAGGPPPEGDVGDLVAFPERVEEVLEHLRDASWGRIR
jgi:hypothetical protein